MNTISISVLINHYLCSDSNWGGIFRCRCVLSIYRIPDGKSFYDEPSRAWSNSVKRIAINEKKSIYTTRLNHEMIDWLTANLKQERWCIGSDEYNKNSEISFPIFFQSFKDAMKFARRWYPDEKISVFNYFTDRRYHRTNRLTK